MSDFEKDGATPAYKSDYGHNEVLHDHDVLGGSSATREDAQHMGTLTEEELLNQKKLLRRIDTMIMPLVMLVSSSMLSRRNEL